MTNPDTLAAMSNGEILTLAITLKEWNMLASSLVHKMHSLEHDLDFQIRQNRTEQEERTDARLRLYQSLYSRLRQACEGK